MKKQFSIILLSMFIGSPLFAQVYTIKRSSGHLVLNLTNVSIEGYDGSEIVINNSSLIEEDGRRKGLHAISGTGLVDNTGIGLYVIEKEGTVDIISLHKHEDNAYIIQVPYALKVSVINNHGGRRIFDGTISVRNLKGEIEISTDYQNIVLSENTGPLSIKTTHGNIDANLGGLTNGPVSLVSGFGYIDVSISKLAKANIDASWTYGAFYAAKELDIQNLVAPEKGEKDVYELVTGQLNGGGFDLKLASQRGNIYLRATETN